MKLYVYILLGALLSSCQPNKTKDERLYEDKTVVVEELKAMYEADQKNRLLLGELKKQQLSDNVYKKKRDSVWAIQTAIDKKNTERLIQITKQYGFPNTERLGAPIAAWVIFQHTPDEYRDEVRKLLAKEDKAGRMPGIEYEMLKWHLGGRKGTPLEALQSKGVNVNDTIQN